jgi:hypothetical protein
MARKNKTKFFLFVVMALLIAGGSLASYWFFIKPQKKSTTVSESTKKQAEQKDSEVAKSDSNKNSKVDTVENEVATESSQVSVTISSIGQSEQTVYISSIVSGATTGTCSLTMKNGTTTITKSANIALQVSYYICQGFNLSSKELVPNGEWTAFIEVNSPNGNSKSEYKKVLVK